MIAISFALPAESSGVLRRLDSKRISQRNGITIFHGELSGREVAIFHTGVGRASCQRSLQAAFGTVRPRLLLSSGFAGSLTDRLVVGDLIVAQNLSDWRLATQLLETPSARPPQPSRFHPAILFTTNRVVESPEERQQIAQQQRADAIDMETEAIATACTVDQIPMVSLRVISDSPLEPFPAPPDVLFDMTRQRTNYWRLVRYLVAHPSAISRFIRFARQISKARSCLTEALVDVVRRI